MRLWDVQSGNVKRTLAESNRLMFGQPGAKNHWGVGVGFSPDGQIVAAENLGNLMLWDAQTGELQHTLTHGLLVSHFTFSPDGKVVATGTGGNTGRPYETIKVWDVRTGQVVRTLETTNKMAVRIAFAPNGKLLAAVIQIGDKHPEVILWDSAEGDHVQTLPDSAGVQTICFAPDGKTLLGAARDKLRSWDVVTGKIMKTSDISTDFTSKFYSVIAFSSDAKILAISGKESKRHVVTLWDVKTLDHIRTLEGHKGDVRAACLFKGRKNACKRR